MSLLLNGPCAACGHTGADHDEGFIGATIGDQAFCHVDDHTCYTPASHRMTRERMTDEIASLLVDPTP